MTIPWKCALYILGPKSSVAYCKYPPALLTCYHSPSFKQIQALVDKVTHMRGVEPSLPELTWSAAMTALSRNGMDVDSACYAIQTDWLQPLYEYIFSDYTAVAKTDMEEIKKIIKDEKQYALEVRIIRSMCYTSVIVCV